MRVVQPRQHALLVHELGFGLGRDTGHLAAHRFDGHAAAERFLAGHVNAAHADVWQLALDFEIVGEFRLWLRLRGFRGAHVHEIVGAGD
jgi:hypothetical protein